MYTYIDGVTNRLIFYGGSVTEHIFRQKRSNKSSIVLVESYNNGIMLGDKGVKSKLAAFSRATIQTPKEECVPVNNIHTYHHDPHLQSSDITIITIIIPEENQGILVSDQHMYRSLEIMVVFSEAPVACETFSLKEECSSRSYPVRSLPPKKTGHRLGMSWDNLLAGGSFGNLHGSLFISLIVAVVEGRLNGNAVHVNVAEIGLDIKPVS